MRWGKRITSSLLASVMAFSLVVTAQAANVTFTDVPESHWANVFVERAAAEGFVAGVGNNKFNPSGTVTYAEFGTMVARSFRNEILSSLEGPFGSDPHWWRIYMEAAHSGGLFNDTKVYEQRTSKDYNYTWDADLVESGISRYEMSQVMYNVINMPGSGIEPPSASAVSAAKENIADWSSVPENYRDAVATCYAAGFLSGVDARGTFDGNATMDRAQSAVVMCRLNGIDVNGGTTTPAGDDEEKPSTVTPVTGDKDANGYTTAASVNNVKNRNKSDAYPTKGNSDTVSVNGYYTGSTVDVGDAVLVYDFLDWVNEARREAGLNELEWVPTDSAEEYTLVRAHDLTIQFSHFGQHAGLSQEVIAWGAGDAAGMFESWMNSQGHRDNLLVPGWKYMGAAKCGANWIITLWDDIAINTCELNSYDYIM